MLPILKRVLGAVSSKDALPILTHFCIYNGRIQGSNGVVCVDSACSYFEGALFTVPALPFIKAVEACKNDPTMTVDDKGRLIIKEGKFKATIGLLSADTYPRMQMTTTGAILDVTGPILPTIARLAPFISSDASRLWTQALLIHDGYAYATNNVVLVRSPIPVKGTVAIPAPAIQELLRLKEEPSHLLIDEGWMAFMYQDYWIRSQLFTQEWPAKMWELFNAWAVDDSYMVPSGMLEAVTTLIPFFPNKRVPVVLLDEQGVSTQDGITTATVECAQFPKSAYRLEPLRDVLQIATHVNFDAYPAPIPFKGPNVEGVMTGMRL